MTELFNILRATAHARESSGPRTTRVISDLRRLESRLICGGLDAIYLDRRYGGKRRRQGGLDALAVIVRARMIFRHPMGRAVRVAARAVVLMNRQLLSARFDSATLGLLLFPARAAWPFPWGGSGSCCACGNTADVPRPDVGSCRRARLLSGHKGVVAAGATPVLRCGSVQSHAQQGAGRSAKASS